MQSCRIKKISNLENLKNLDVLDLHGNQVQYSNLIMYVCCVKHHVFAVSFTKVFFHERELVSSFAVLEVTEVSKLIKGVMMFVFNLCTSLLYFRKAAVIKMLS